MAFTDVSILDAMNGQTGGIIWTASSLARATDIGIKTIRRSLQRLEIEGKVVPLNPTNMTMARGSLGKTWVVAAFKYWI